MIRAIIFDCFGVLTVDGWLKFCDKYFGHSPHREEAHRLNREVDSGNIPAKQFFDEVAKLAGVSAQEAERQIMEIQPKNTDLLNYIRTLKPRYKTAILSNVADAGWFRSYFSDDELKLFDEVVTSVEEGIIKPDPRIFEIALSRLGIEADEALFIDDRQKNLDGAVKVGIKPILYTDIIQFKQELSEALQSSPADN